MIFGINTTNDISKLSQITHNNFEISLVVFMPNITTNHAITYPNLKLQNWHRKLSYVSVPRWRRKLKMQWRWDALENLYTRKSTSRRILTGILSKNSEPKPNLSSKLLREWSFRTIRSRINISKIHDCELNSSPVILIVNQLVYSPN